MGRINLAADDSLVSTLSEEARKQNKTLYAITNEAIKTYLDILGSGKTAESVINVLRLFEIYDSASVVPVPEVLLDETLRIASQCSKDETLKAWEQQGVVVGELLKHFAPKIDDVKLILENFKTLIPPSLLQLEIRDDEIEVVMTGTGYSPEASRCTAAGIKGFLSSYGCETEDIEVSRGFVKVVAVKTGARALEKLG